MKYLYKYIISVVALLIVPMLVGAQQREVSALVFDVVNYDYGHIDEDGGSVVCYFVAQNRGAKDVEVVNIMTTCGCTSAKYEKNPIPPGGIFRFEVSFNPINRPGRIDKQIFVHVSDSPNEIRLNILGYVNPRQRTVEELYPFDMGGGLRLKSNFHAFGYLEHGKELIEHIGFVNTSARAVEVSVIKESVSGLLDIQMPERVEAGASGDIVLRYAVAERSDIYGTMRDIVYLEVDGVKAYYPLSTQVVVVDNFDNMDDISAPRLVVSKNIIKFGDVNVSNGVLERMVELRNEGASPLVVRRIECSDRAVECVVDRDVVIAAGESMEIVVRIYGNRIEDVDNPLVARLYVITNDPMRPMQTIRVNAIPI